ncbi:hypothetical protein SKAU_G00350860 [Synaphobranchus kaupii]|uniref:BEN domain-containing protein n=1 Tax=Synaphobranchus kaupii TaxID=118154 RepID=A0A9Q1IG01_SYNKA|nr:hypothetical protein SKAU_G00350860 [Synaphobranchus kaupii]
MFADVRFLDDNIHQTVPIEYIKDFKPKDLTDFCIKKKYSILWKKTPEDGGFYYAAQILKLADPGTSRIPVPHVSSDDEMTEHRDDCRACSGTAVKEKKKNNEESHKKSLLEIMKGKKKQIITKRQREIPESDDDAVVPFEIHQELQNKCILLKKKQREYEDLIAEKEAAVKKLTEKNREMSSELKKLRQLNICLQEQLLLQKPGSQQMQVPLMIHDTDTVPQSKVLPVPLVKVEDGKVDLGSGILLDKKKWYVIRAVKSHSVFCKSLAVAIWGKETLQQRSVTGTKANSVKGSVAKPPLTPEKVGVIRECLVKRLQEEGYQKEAIDRQLSLVRRAISEKICDIKKTVQLTSDRASAGPSSSE